MRRKVRGWIITAWVVGWAGAMMGNILVAQNVSLEKNPALAAGAVATQSSKLGKVDFPTSGAEPAQSHFLRGVAALHSFWYDEALEAFRASTQADPNFMMGYWGEAMTHNHPIWHQQDAEEAKKVLQKIRDTEKLTPRERAYLNAIKILYGEGDKLDRDMAYAAAMEKIYRDYPEDLEAAAFYALSLLGTVRPGDKGFRRQTQAGAIALEVYQKNPEHPGAAHYIIHAFDDPEHAILALPAARHYAEIAPAAHHARHMPSHIFLQLGMWPEAAASNESAWEVSDAWVRRKGLSIGQRDYHSFHWLLYIYLQQGRYSKAEELLTQLRQTIENAPDDKSSIGRSYAAMAAAFAVETQRWDAAAQLIKRPGGKVSVGAAAAPGAAHCATTDSKTKKPVKAKGAARYRASESRRLSGELLTVFIPGLAAGIQGRAGTEKIRAELQAIRKELDETGESYRAKIVKIMEWELAALISAAKGRYKEAIERMKSATALEEELSPPSGPPDVIKPSHELFGEILLRAGRPKEAAKQFATALLRQPQRARSLLGAARAAAQSGDRSAAATAYASLLRIWAQADAALPERREAQEYLQQASLH